MQGRLGLRQCPNTPLFGFVGRLDEQKGVDILLQALPELLGPSAMDVLSRETLQRQQQQQQLTQQLSQQQHPHLNHVVALPLQSQRAGSGEAAGVQPNTVAGESGGAGVQADQGSSRAHADQGVSQAQLEQVASRVPLSWREHKHSARKVVKRKVSRVAQWPPKAVSVQSESNSSSDGSLVVDSSVHGSSSAVANGSSNSSIKTVMIGSSSSSDRDNSGYGLPAPPLQAVLLGEAYEDMHSLVSFA